MTPTRLTNILKFLKAGSLTLKELTELHNQLSTRPVKTFGSKAKATAKTQPLVEQALAAARTKAPKRRAAPRKYKGLAIATICRRLLAARLPEEEAKRQMREDYGIPTKKLSYYNWNRNLMRRNGQL